MAKIIEETIVIKVSKVVKETSEETINLPDEFFDSVEQIVGEMLNDDPKLIVEVVEDE